METDEENIDLNELLRKARKDKNLLQKDLANKLKVSHKTIIDWENKKVIPNEDNIAKIALVLDLDEGVLFALAKKDREKQRQYSLYKHTSPSGKIYIGITKQDVKKRWQYGAGYEGNTHFNNAIKKYGWENFTHEIVYKNLTEEEAKQKEIELIRQYQSDDRNYGYNVSPGGNTVSEESVKKAGITRKNRGIDKKESKRMKSRWADPVIRSDIIAKMQNKPRTDEQKAHMKASSARKGKPLPLRTREKLSIINKEKTGEKAIRSRRVVAVNPFTGEIEKRYVSAREAALDMHDNSISSISNMCSGTSGNKSGFKHGYFWSWEDEYYPGRFPTITQDDITDKGKLKRKAATIWSYGKTISERQKKAISDAHRIPVVCLDTGVVFSSMREAGLYYGIDPSLISRQIKGKNKTAGGFRWEYYDIYNRTDETNK